MNLAPVIEFMNQHKTCVLSSVNGDKPQSATVGFSVDDDFKILIATKSSTRKASNIVNNPNVSLVIGFSGDKTLQIDGVAKELDRYTNNDRVELHFEKVPGAKKYAQDDGQVYFLITPTWMRFTDYNAENGVYETENF